MELGCSRRRLRQKDLVMNIFFLFEREYERSQVESIWEIRLPIERVKQELEAATSVHYRSNLWIYTQLRRYEEDLGVQLFRKDSAGCKAGSFHLSVHDRMLKFHQKQHLYVSDKIKVANGVYDKITNEATAKGLSTVRLYLGAGSTIFHLADLFAESSCRDPLRYCIHTHNVGVLKRLLESPVDYRNIDLFTPRGQVDPDTYAILGDGADLDRLDPFDYVVMGTSYVLNGELYVESAKETEFKGEILRRTRGEKILILTMREFCDKPLPGLRPYGAIRDYDTVIIPRHGGDHHVRKSGDRLFERYQDLFVPQIVNWNYVILKVR